MSKSDQIVCIETGLIQERIEILKRQTSYSHEQAEEALKKNNYDTMACIREYLEVPQKKEDSTKKSINQQIYKELRNQLGTVNPPTIEK
jgi:predicted nucleic acid-binding protein